MGPRRARSLVLDAGALIAFERNNKGVRQLVNLAFEHKVPVHVPVGVVGQVWRDGSRQVRLARLLNSEEVAIQELSFIEAKAAGVLCGIAATSDVVDASVVLLARREKAVVVTSDPDDLISIDPRLFVRRC